MEMEISADEFGADPPDDEYLECVWFRDNQTDYTFALSRYADEAQDDGKIDVLVRDQIHTATDNLLIVLRPTKIEAAFDDETAANLHGLRRIIVHFGASHDEYERIRSILSHIFRDLSGLSEIPANIG